MSKTWGPKGALLAKKSWVSHHWYPRLTPSDVTVIHDQEESKRAQFALLLSIREEWLCSLYAALKSFRCCRSIPGWKLSHEKGRLDNSWEPAMTKTGKKPGYN